MEELLKPVSMSYTSSESSRPLLEEVKSTTISNMSRAPLKPSTREECLEALKGEPHYDSLVATLDFLAGSGADSQPFSIASPDPENAKIVQVLVADIVPNYWALFKEEKTVSRGQKGRPTRSPLELLLDCLRSVAGINAIVARLRALIAETKSEPVGARRSDTVLNIGIFLELIRDLLHGHDRIRRIWSAIISKLDNPNKERPLAQELVNLLGGGRIVSFTAEAEEVVKENGKGQVAFWVANGADYSQWVSHNVINWAREADSPEQVKICSGLLAKNLRLGPTGKYLEDVSSPDKR